ANAAAAAWRAAVDALASPTAGMWWSLAVVAIVAAIMLVAGRVHRAIPGSLVAVIAATALAELAGAPLTRIGALPDGLPAPEVPTADLAAMGTLLGAALTVAALAGIESLLSVKVASTMSDTGLPQPDRELVGQGLASIASGLFGD